MFLLNAVIILSLIGVLTLLLWGGARQKFSFGELSFYAGISITGGTLGAYIYNVWLI